MRILNEGSYFQEGSYFKEQLSTAASRGILKTATTYRMEIFKTITKSWKLVFSQNILS